jgi:hypothetical protein
MDAALQAFNDLMNGGGSWSLLVGAVAALLAAPLLVLIHELGHATVGLLRTEGLVSVRVGRAPALWRFRAGRLRLELNPMPARNGPAGLATVYARFGVGTKVALALAGPFAQAVAALAIALVGARMGSTIVEVVGGLGIAEALLNLVPRERKGLRSDGTYLLDALRGSRISPAAR